MKKLILAFATVAFIGFGSNAASAQTPPTTIPGSGDTPPRVQGVGRHLAHPESSDYVDSTHDTIPTHAVDYVAGGRRPPTTLRSPPPPPRCR